ncbi:MAG: hypothetical protein OIN66_18325 [Candidatus Methanoperedens sp.]|nr:hypothetical protein [Candidatus Methanoperedens sp.]
MSDIILKHHGILIVTIFALLLFLSSTANASDFRSGDRLVIAKDQVINDDLYFAGSSITVDGIINGDLIVAGGDIRVSGTVNGSLMAAGGTITVTGNVTDDIRAAGGNIMIDGSAGDNALIFGGNLALGKNARINRDLTIGAGSAAIDGIVNGNLNGSASSMDMSGSVAGNVTVGIDNRLRVLPGAKIGGNLEYTSPRPAEISGTVSGKTVYTQRPTRERGLLAGLAGEVFSYLWLLLIGIVLLIIAPGITQRIADNVHVNPLKKALWGILFLIVTPILAVILLITLIGIPLGLILIAIYIIAVYVSRVFIGLWVGQYVLRRLNRETRHKALSLAIGLLIVFIGINLPILGIFIHFVIIVLGLGALVMAGYELYQRSRGEKAV